MVNKLDKFLISFSGVAVMTLGVLGLKFQKDLKDIRILNENLQISLATADKVKNMIDLQERMESARMENLKKVDNAQIGTKTETKTQTIVIPGKTVAETTVKKSSSKTTKSS